MNDSTNSNFYTQNWSLAHKIGFRFCCIFFLLNIFPFPLNNIPVIGEFVSKPLDSIWDALINWSGKTFFNIPEITIRPNGSGDTTWNWIQQFAIIIISLLGTVVWSFIARNTPNHNKLNYWTNNYIRYYLALTLMTYGIVKIFPSQFGNITNYRLHQQLGDMSPMGLLWTFMAYSKSYQFFGGLMECMGALLLLFRRTMLLGALITAGVLLNVFALNICYDVPVKLYSFLLMLMAIYLTAPSLGRLWSFFILHQSTSIPPQYKPDFLSKKWSKISRIVLKTVVISGLTIPLVMELWGSEMDNTKPLGAFYGSYTVEKHIKNALELPPTDSTRWEKFFIDRRGYYDMIYVSNEMGVRDRINFEKNDSTQTLILSTVSDTSKYTFHYQQPDSTKLILTGKFKNDSLNFVLTKQKNKDFLLIKRGFHWVNEYPFNK